MRSGELTDSRFGFRMTGEGPYAESIAALFAAASRRAGLPKVQHSLDLSRFRVPTAQPGLFDLPDD